jgi:hypothetical protein
MMGKDVRRVARIPQKSKDFITKLYFSGAGSAKLSPEQMAQQMQEEIVKEEYYFHPDEYLQPQQIRNLISRLKQQENNKVTEVPNLSEDDGILYHIDEICDSVLQSDTEDSED